MQVIVVMENGPAQIPPDGYVDNPKEVREYLSRYPVRIDLPNAVSDNDYDGGKVDDILSKGLLQLSLQDRNAINEEIHGVQTLSPEETPDMLTKALRDLQFEIDNNQNKAAYDRSQQFPNTYVNSIDFRLRFLRCDLFDEKKAAKKLLKFLDLISEIFGDFVLRRSIQMSDFSRDEMQFFRVGHFQLLPYRDRSGRRIFTLVGGIGLHVPLVTRVSNTHSLYLWRASQPSIMNDQPRINKRHKSLLLCQNGFMPIDDASYLTPSFDFHYAILGQNSYIYTTNSIR